MSCGILSLPSCYSNLHMACNVGQSEKHEFQAETKMLLDIVAKSLYSEKEVSCLKFKIVV